MGTVKLTVSLSDEVVDALKEMAAEERTSVTEQIRRAVSLQKWMYDLQRRKAKLLVEEVNGSPREVVVLR
ncbi:ribbon-helix-helix protein, CopG family [Actinoplanes sp. TFC3]|uniref:ribbon-helix-helix protein, CopG family n=1 Tax=Actinoplanes sp. TFC3 TaxID=1710355 RepID=UPI000AACC45A|nr:ribbon-helix-helix protein, CopG family [Actinoplanes sp. TFC3]